MKKILASALCLLLFLTACGGKKSELAADRGKGLSKTVTATVGISDAQAPEGYTAVARNEKYALFADMKTGDFAVWDFLNARFTYSGQQEALDPDSPISGLNFGRVKTDLVSLIAIQYVQVSTIASTAVPFYQNSYAYSVMKNNVKTQTIENGYRAEFTFSDINAVVPVEITLQSTGIAVRIVGEGMKVGDDYRITSISLLPGFMAGYEENDGYLFIPSGSGALIPLASGRGDSAVYHETVYGDDRAIAVEEYESESEQISVPVYGIKDGDYGVFAVITQGDATAEIEAAANSSTSCFTRVFSDYVTAVIDSTTLFESNFENQRVVYGAEERTVFGDYEVQYHFLSGEDATWVGMATLYRRQLALKKNPKAPQLMLTLYGTAQKKATFLGIPYQKNIALTSFSGAQEILDDLYKDGISASLRFVGWNDAGIRNKKLPLTFSPGGVLGGKKGFRTLTDSLDDTKTTAFFDVDLMTFRNSGRGFSVYSDVCKSIFNTRTPIYQFMRSTYVPVNNENPSYLLTPQNVVSAAQKFLKKANEIKGLSLGDMGSTLYSDFAEGRGREDSLIAFTELFAKASENHSLAFQNANAYAFPYADRICSLPMTSDGNLLFSKDVPFLQLLLHGSLSYAAESSADLLDCIAYGADPQLVAISGDDSELIETSYNWLYGTEYRDLSEKAKEEFAQYQSVYQSLYQAVITDYRQEGQLSKTVFDTGAAVLVNRANRPQTMDGVTVEPGGFIVIKEADVS